MRSGVQRVHICRVPRVRGPERPDQFGRRVHDAKALRDGLNVWRAIARPAIRIEFNRVGPRRQRGVGKEEAHDIVTNNHAGVVFGRSCKGFERNDSVVLVAHRKGCHVIVHNGAKVIQGQFGTDLGDKAYIDPRAGNHARRSRIRRLFVCNTTVQHFAGLFVQIAPALINVGIADVARRGADHPETIGRAAQMNRCQCIVQRNTATVREDKLRCQIQDAGGIKDNTCRICRQGIQRHIDIAPAIDRRLTQLVARTRPGQFLCRAGGTVLNDRNRDIIPH